MVNHAGLGRARGAALHHCGFSLSWITTLAVAPTGAFPERSSLLLPQAAGWPRFVDARCLMRPVTVTLWAAGDGNPHLARCCAISVVARAPLAYWKGRPALPGSAWDRAPEIIRPHCNQGDGHQCRLVAWGHFGGASTRVLFK